MDNFKIQSSSNGLRKVYRGGARTQQGGGFKKGKNRNRNRRYNNQMYNALSMLPDDDIAMDGNAQPGPSQRYNPYGANRGKKGRGNIQRAGLDRNHQSVLQRLGLPMSSAARSQRSSEAASSNDGSDFYKVVIPYGKKHEKEFILKSITSASSVPFVPINFGYDQLSAVFYVKGSAAANAIRQVSRRITTPNGFKLITVVTKSSPPRTTNLSAEVLEKLKLAMSNRYDASVNSLNLSDLYHDEALNKEYIVLSLSRPDVCAAVIKIIQENIPELTVLDLSNNMLFSTESLAGLVEAASKLKRLNLSSNKMKSERDLRHIQKLSLEELRLEGNPLCNRFTDQAEYISAIRKQFPQVTKLDGFELPPPITFGIETETKLPETLGSFFVNSQFQDLVTKFIQQYFTIFDSEDRKPLEAAYHEEAKFSICCCFNSLYSNKQPNFRELVRDNRNLLQVTDIERRFRYLYCGKSAVMKALQELPATQHALDSFIVDVNHSSSTLLSFTVHGIFREVSSKASFIPVRQFNRIFLTIPYGSGIVVINEMLNVTNVSLECAKTAFKTVPLPTASTTTTAVSTTAETQPASTVSAPQMEMVRSFATQSGMNEVWSSRCLMQCDWDFNKAAGIFKELHQAGKIPQEAFIK